MKEITKINLRCLLVFFFILLYSHGCSQQIFIDAKKPYKPLFKVFPVYRDDRQPSDILKIFMIQEGKESETPLLGNYSVTEDTLFFEPQFELGDGLAFSAHFYNKNDTVKSFYKTPSISLNINKEVVIKDIFPRSHEIPKNILTLYVEFSEPMMEDEAAFRFINLYNENDEILPNVWLNKSRWVNNKILMLMIHPGRVKSGISYYDNLGDIFDVGKKYHLEITNKVKPLYKNAKVKPFIKEFKIIEAETSCPKILSNKINKLKKNTREKLKIVFSRTMDLYSILGGISVSTYKTNLNIEGELVPGKDDTEWYFVPDKPWQEEKYTLIFSTYVSDPSGNGLIKPFETRNIKKIYSKEIVKRINFKTN